MFTRIGANRFALREVKIEKPRIFVVLMLPVFREDFPTSCFQLSLKRRKGISLCSKQMSLPSDQESLLAAWNAIGPSQPFPHEVEGILLSYFKHVEMHGENTRRMLAPAQTETNLAPPTRFDQQLHTNKKAPLGPAGATMLCHAQSARKRRHACTCTCNQPT
jgi:hypothetical protein